MNIFSFKKENRITLRNEIDTLFRYGKVFYSGPLRLVYRIGKEGVPGIKILITVPRKKFRNATHRNRLKRLMREAYRLNHRNIIPETRILSLNIRAGLIYTGERHDVPFNDMEKWVTAALKHLAGEISAVKVTD
ncbi:MAG TPA: ribonuclease P protein component [Bacteroidales bacterium]|jgi:ribonuclease P protein component|nr:ribonuclease P protein component [Bacteroidales bacterium]